MMFLVLLSLLMFSGLYAESSDLVKVNYKIIEHGSEDYFKSVALRKDVYKELIDGSSRESLIKQLVEEKDFTQVVGVIEGEVVATAHLAHKKNKIRLRRVAVKKELQNKKIGSGLLDYCEKFAISQGCRQMYVYSLESAIGFYSKWGFISFGEIQVGKSNTPYQLMYKPLSDINLN